MYITETDIEKNGSKGYVEMIIEDGDMPWEGGINGKFYRISRGIPVKVPRSLARLICESARVILLAKSELADYESGNGKCLSTSGKRGRGKA